MCQVKKKWNLKTRGYKISGLYITNVSQLANFGDNEKTIIFLLKETFFV